MSKNRRSKSRCSLWMKLVFKKKRFSSVGTSGHARNFIDNTAENCFPEVQFLSVKFRKYQNRRTSEKKTIRQKIQMDMEDAVLPISPNFLRQRSENFPQSPKIRKTLKNFREKFLLERFLWAHWVLVWKSIQKASFWKIRRIFWWMSEIVHSFFS